MQRVAYLVAISGAFLKLLTLHCCHLTNPAEIRNPAKITLELDLGRIRKNDQILTGAGFGAEFRYSPTIYVSPGKKVSVFSSVQLCILHRKNVAK